MKYEIYIDLEDFIREAIVNEGMYEVTANLLNVFSEVREVNGYDKDTAKKVIKHLHKVCDALEG